MDIDLEHFAHVNRVRDLITLAIEDLLDRANRHDASKFIEPELSAFRELAPRLRAVTYGSDEYKAFLSALGPALSHHYQHNRHHPEYHPAGIQGMNLLDLLEMLLDWKAASERHHDGSLAYSIEQNQQRFGYPDSFKGILINTATYLDIYHEPKQRGRT